MSATAKLAHALGLARAGVEEISTLGHSLARTADAIQRYCMEIDRRQVTWGDVLAKRVKWDYDLRAADELCSRAHEMLKHGDLTFAMEGDTHSLRAELDLLIAAIANARMYIGGTSAN